MLKQVQHDLSTIIVKTKHRKSKRNYLILPIILVVLGLLIWFLVKVFFSSSWDGKSRFTVIFSTRPVMVVSYNPADDSIAAVSLPQDTYVDATHGYGRYRLGKVYDVGNLDKKGPQVLKSTARELLGIPIDGYIDVKNLELSESENLNTAEFIAKRKIILGLTNFLLFHDKTDLSLSDLWQFYSRVFSVKAGKISFVNLKNAGVLEAQILPDGSNILMANTQALDGLLRNLFHEDALVNENFKLAVLNSTSVSGLGDKTARILDNMGLQVVSVANYQTMTDKCLLFVDKKIVNFLTVIKLKREFDCLVKTTNISNVRADVSFVLGNNYALELTSK